MMKVLECEIYKVSYNIYMEKENEQNKHIPERVVSGLRELASDEKKIHDYEHPPELTDEVKRIRMIKAAAKKGIIARASEYVKLNAEERKEKRYLLEEIQQIVDELDDAFVLVVGQKDGVPYTITFNPHKEIPIDETADSPAA
jgi:phosphosulfolactate synthase (CoM biosynthesis protein A)